MPGGRVLRFKIKELIARREFDEGHRITLIDIAEATGIHRMTLSKIVNHKGYSTGTDKLDSLCKYFGCRIEELVEYLPD